MVVSEAAERKDVASRIPIGECRPIREDDIWANVAANLGRQPIKASALEFLKQRTSIQRGTQMALPLSLERAEHRERVGDPYTPAAPSARRRPPPARPRRVEDTFKDYALGFVHIDVKHLPKLQTSNGEQRKRYLFVATNRRARGAPRDQGR
jgi:hypothetical protein